MKVKADIRRAFEDRHLLGAGLAAGGPSATDHGPQTWATWRAVLAATWGLPLTSEEAQLFGQVSGGRAPPIKRVSERWTIAGRRSGKSRIAALEATFIATFIDHRQNLAPGERGYVLVLSPSKDQSKVISGYAEGFLRASPFLSQLIDKVSAEEIRLNNGVSILVHTNSFRSVRGRTLVACIFDESAFWRDETSANPDIETYRAIIPALSTTKGMLIGISSPYRKIGLLYQKHRDHFGRDGNILVIQGDTRTFNPTIDQEIIESAIEDDPEAARSEWQGMFREGISSLLPDEVIDAAIDPDRPIEIPPKPGVHYVAFADASAGRNDSFTITIGHREADGRFVADVVRGTKAPFKPNAVAAEYAGLAKWYRCARITGDNYAGEWVAGAFKDAGIDYRRSDLTRSELYLEAVPQFMRGVVTIPDNPILIRELRLLERRVAPSGKDRVDHPANGSDDYANALAGAMWLAASKRSSFKITPQAIQQIGPGWRQHKAFF